MDICISRIGSAVPQFQSTQTAVAEFISDRLMLSSSMKRRVQALYKASGIEWRHSIIGDYLKNEEDFIFFPKLKGKTESFPSTKQRMALYQKNALALAMRAIDNACAGNDDLNTPFDLNTLTHIITVSCTAMQSPGLDIELIFEYNLPTHIQRLAINFMGCYGSFNALRTAHAICKANPNAKVLILSLELCSLHFQPPQNIDQLIAGAIFSDGAGAMIVETQPSQKKYFSLQHFYSDLIPNTDKAMAWSIGDHGFDIVLSSYVPELIESVISKFLNTCLKQLNLSKNDIDHYAIHPGGIKILQACEKALNIPAEENRHAYEVLKYYGNMSSATIIFVLQKLWDNLTQANQNQTIFSCAFGPGLTLESVLLKIYHP